MTRRRLVAQATALLGDAKPIVVEPAAWAALVAPARSTVGGDGGAGGLVSFLGERLDRGARLARLDALAARLPAGAPLVVVDHNQPRTWWRRALGAVALAARGLGPARARHLVAREVHGQGFAVERLELACGERVQLVLARRR